MLLLLMKSHKSFSLARSPLLPAGVGGFICTHLERPWIGSSSRGVIETLETWKIYENMGWTSLFFRGYFLLSKESSGPQIRFLRCLILNCQSNCLFDCLFGCPLHWGRRSQIFGKPMSIPSKANSRQAGDWSVNFRGLGLNDLTRRESM
jgi:hypothetical protein